jgi:zinc protease
MGFNGSRHFAPGELVPWMESIGIRFGADTNAYTSYDETVYQLQVPTDKEGALEKGLLVLADWAGGATLSTEEIDKERGVVLDELRRGKGAGRRIRDVQDQLVFRGSRYADRLPIGLETVITGASPDVLRDFYGRWYRPDVMALFAVGDLDEGDMVARIRAAFGEIEAPRSPTVVPEWPVPPQEGTLYSVESDPELTSSRVQVLYRHAAEPPRTVGEMRRDTVRRIAASLLSQRLSERAQAADPPFLTASAGLGSRVRTLETFALFGSAKDGEVPAAAAALLEELERARRHGFVAAELDRIKTSALAAVERRLKEAPQRRSGARIGGLVAAFLDDLVVTSDQYDHDLAQALVPGIGLEEVNEALRRMSDPRNRVVLVQVPEKEGLAAPAVEQVRAAVEPPDGFDVAAYQDDLGGRTLVDFAPTPGRVVSRRERPELGVTELTLANGLRVVLKPTDFRADEIQMRGLALEGASRFGERGYPAAIRADTLASRSGLADFTAPQLSKSLQSQGVIAGASPGVSRFARTFSGSARPQDLETMLALVHLYFVRPAFREEAFQRMVDGEVERLENELNSPGGVYGRAVSEELYGDHWLFRPATVELVRSLEPGALERAYREMFGDASEWTFFLVGNVDLPAHVPLLETWLGSLPTTSAAPRDVRHPSWRQLRLRFPPGHRRREVRKGLEDQARTLFTTPATTLLDPQADFDVEAAADLLELRLRDALREDLGETYGVGVGHASLRPFRRYGRVSVSWTSAPGPRERMLEIVKDTVRGLRAATPSADDVRKLREMRHNALAEAEKENGYWTGALFSSHLLGRDPREILQRRERIDRLTARSLRAAIRRWLRLRPSLEVFLVPESSPATKAAEPAPGPDPAGG